MVYDLIGGAHSSLVIRVMGDDLSEDRRIASETVSLLRKIRGTAQASIFQEPPLPQIAIETDRAAAARYGINVSDITNLIQNGIGGGAITRVFVGDRVYNLTLRFPLNSRSDPEALGSLPLTSSSGAQVPLSQVATVKQQNGESVITRENNHRNLTVRVDLAGRDMVSYLNEVKARIAQSVQFDQSKYHLEYGGQYENEQRAQARLTLILGLVLGLMTLLLFTEFGKLRQALLILGIVPLAAFGGLLALYIRGETLNVATAVGFIALFGVAVQNGIIMVANLNRMRETGASLYRGDNCGCERALPPGADDRDGGNHRHVTGSDGNRRGQRRAAWSGDRCHRRPDSGDAADALHPADFLFRDRTQGRALGSGKKSASS